MDFTHKLLDTAPDAVTTTAVELVLDVVAVELLATGGDTALASAAAAMLLVGAVKLVVSLRNCVHQLLEIYVESVITPAEHTCKEASL